jgi:hypothetical protein
VTTTTTDKPVMDLTTKDWPNQVAEAQHLEQPTHSPPRTKHSRAFAGVAATTVALAAAGVLALAAFGPDSSSTSVNRVVAIERVDAKDHPGYGPITDARDQPEAVQTELDVRGVPTWWARDGVPVEHDDARDQPEAVQTELDVRGVPTWWARGSASCRGGCAGDGEESAQRRIEVGVAPGERRVP